MTGDGSGKAREEEEEEEEDDPEDQRGRLARRLLAASGKLPSSRFARMTRQAATGWRLSRLLARIEKRGGDDLSDEEAQALVSGIAELKGVAMKMGQIMSYIDVALPEPARQALSVLQTHAHAMPGEQVASILVDALGDRGRELAGSLDPVPVAAASIGQVHRARLPEGTPVAVKVRYPEVEAAIRADFSVASIGPRMARLFYPGAKVGPLIEEAQARFIEECDYEHEAAAQERFCELYRDHPVLEVPEVHRPWCGHQVLTTTFVEAPGFHAFLATDPPQGTRDRVGQALFEFYIGSLFEHGVYNCDPHPGNYLFPGDDRVVLLDHGCTRGFPSGTVEQLARISQAVHTGDRPALEKVLVEMDVIDPGDHEPAASAWKLFTAFHGPLVQDRVQPVDLGEALGMRGVLGGKRELMKLRLPGSFLFLFRIRVGLFSVLADLGAQANWHELEMGYTERVLT